MNNPVAKCFKMSRGILYMSTSKDAGFTSAVTESEAGNAPSVSHGDM